MSRKSLTAIAMMAVLFISTATMSAQDKKQIEKKIRIVTVNEKCDNKDTTYTYVDTLIFNGGDMFFETREGRKMLPPMGRGDRMIVRANRMMEMEGQAGDAPMEGPECGNAPMKGKQHAPGQGPMAKEGVNYVLNIDGVLVTIRAPKEKAGEADQILNEAKKVLMKK